MTKQQYLIISPVNQYGGVNLDVGFIAKTVSQNDTEVFVLSHGKYFDDCSLFDMIPVSSYTSVDKVLYENNTLIKLSLRLLGLLKPMPIPLHHRIKNLLTKSLSNVNKKRLEVLKQYVSEYDKIILCSQLTGQWNEEIIQIASQLKKPIYFRITQQINPERITEKQLFWLKEVSHFIHHSKQNLDILAEILPTNKHTCIDQCVMWEEDFLAISPLKKSVSSFYSISRLEHTKRIDKMIEAFNGLKNEGLSLHIYGDGSLKSKLEKLSLDNPRIRFYGAIALKDIVKVHGQHDCLMITSTIEGGPYTGVEAMAAGRLIISSRVGAMETRLPHYPFFYDGSVEDLRKKMLLLLNQEAVENQKLSNQLRQRYTENYSEAAIGKSYLDILV